MSQFTKFVSGLVADARQANVLAALFVGFITGTNILIIGSALAGLKHYQAF